MLGIEGVQNEYLNVLRAGRLVQTRDLDVSEPVRGEMRFDDLAFGFTFTYIMIGSEGTAIVVGVDLSAFALVHLYSIGRYGVGGDNFGV